MKENLTVLRFTRLKTRTLRNVSIRLLYSEYIVIILSDPYHWSLRASVSVLPGFALF